ncbi:universal stress protein [Streptomyces sclerotialus]|uniref:universal stress protein n=1 Tax=Streptomyces sclerotialus TaxID=1957 RepID=UPI0004CC8781
MVDHRPVVVGADGSAWSLQAVDWAVDAAVRYGVRLRIVHAFREKERQAEHVPGRPPAESPESLVSVASERASRRARGLKVTTRLMPLAPEAALTAESREARVVVVGHRGRGRLASSLLGSVGRGVAARAHCPVVVVRGRAANIAGRNRLVCLGIGNRMPGTGAAAFAFEEAALRGGHIAAVHAWLCTSAEARERHGLLSECRAAHERRAKELFDEVLTEQVRTRPRLEVHHRTVEGAPGTVLTAASMTADLLVVGARRRKTPFGPHLGSVGHTVLHHALCPVAVVPEG